MRVAAAELLVLLLLATLSPAPLAAGAPAEPSTPSLAGAAPLQGDPTDATDPTDLAPPPPEGEVDEAEEGEVKEGEDEEAEENGDDGDGEEGEKGEEGEEGEDDEDDGDGEDGEEGEEEEDEGPRLDRITFELPVPPEKGGGTLSGSAASLDYEREDFVLLVGDVEVRYRDLTLKAQSVRVDLTRQFLTAEGDVVLDEGPRRLAGATLEYDIESGTGVLTDATAFVDPDMYFEGRRIEKTGEDTFTVERGTFTSCEGKRPAWSFRAGKAHVEVEGYARVRNASMRIKEVPFLYSPYILWPVKSKRTSGLLVPNIGSSRTRGDYLGLAYYQVLGDSYDTTFLLDLYSEEFYGLGNEFRYLPSEFTEGHFEAYAIADPELDDVRWKVDWNHESNRLPWGLRGVLTYQDFSDFDFFQDFERDFDRISLRSLYSRGFLTRNWGNHSFNFLVDTRETFIGGDVVTQRQLPEVEYSLRQTQLGKTPLFLQLRSSAHYFSAERTDALSGQYGRVDLLPQLTLPFQVAPWLSLSVTGVNRLTWYSDSLDSTRLAFSGDGLTRVLPSASAEIIGPSFSRIFDLSLGGFAKFKHVIEPRWTYLWSDEHDDALLVPSFDEIDRASLARRIGTFQLANRLLAKPVDEEEEGGAREILSLELSQSYSFEDDQPFQVSPDGLRSSQKSPIDARLRFNPTSAVSVQAQALYATLFGRLTTTSLTGSLAAGMNNALVSWITRFDAETGDTLSHQLRVGGSADLVPERLRLSASATLDLNATGPQPSLPQQRYVIEYTARCYGLRLEFQEFTSINREDRNVRLAVSLKNVGTFLDLTGGTTRQN